MKRGSLTREERLAAALRENLKRRKARARARGMAEGDKTRDKDAEAPPARREEATKRV